MWHSLELRVPYLDHRFVEEVMTIPPRLKIRGLKQKHLLKEVAARWLPAPVINHRKQGFEAPMGRWLRGPLKTMMQETLSPQAVEAAGIFSASEVERLMREHLTGLAQAQQAAVLALDVPAVARAEPACVQRPPRATGDRDLRMSTLALTWMDQRRTQELCAGLDLELVVLKTRWRGPLRYVLLGWRTMNLLVRRRARVLLVQNPSLILATLAVLLRPMLGYRLIVDAHNEAVEPFINRQRWVKSLSRWVIRKADLTIVSNRQLAALVDGRGGRSFALPDPIPTPPAALPARTLDGAFNVVLIATHAPDEPIEQVFEAVRGTDVNLYVTGNPQRMAATLAARAPENVRFTGFLPDQDYWALLGSADGIIDLTLMEDCLVSGAYEALAVGTPMLLSNNRASVELFGGAAAFTDNTTADIRRGLERLRLSRGDLRAAAERKRGELTERWIASARDLMRMISVEQSPAVKLDG